MGLVYLAEHATLKRKVALKLLRPELIGDPLWLQRFFSEARAVNAIGHENIVEITDFVDSGEHRFFVMELLRGQGLAELIKAGRMPLPRAVHIAGQMAAALEATHACGIIHRDQTVPVRAERSRQRYLRRTDSMTTAVLGTSFMPSFMPVGTTSIFFTTSRPLMTLPNTV